jgi:CBS domain-containing protein
MKVRDILKTKGPEVLTIGEEKLLSEAIEKLVVNKIGVLLVLSAQAKIIGIISERDIVRVCHSAPNDYGNKLIKEVMTTNVIIAEADDEVDYVESTMTENRIRHLPIVDKKVLVGLISIGDLVKNQLHKQRSENKYLMDYISGTS